MTVKAAVPFELDECFRHRPTNRRIRCAPQHSCTLLEVPDNATFTSSFTKCNQRELFESKTDPITGFARSTTDFALNRSVSFLTPLSDKPHSYNPRHLHSVRVYNLFAPPETQRVSEKDPGGPYTWNERKFNESQIRASLYGQTPDQESRRSQIMASKDSKDTISDRDALAIKYMYKSSTQRAFEQIPWDTALAPRRWSAITTLEGMPQAGYSLLANTQVKK